MDDIERIKKCEESLKLEISELKLIVILEYKSTSKDNYKF